MKARRKYTDEQVVSILQEHQGGVTAKEIIRRHGISLDTFYRWKRNGSENETGFPPPSAYAFSPPANPMGSCCVNLPVLWKASVSSGRTCPR